MNDDDTAHYQSFAAGMSLLSGAFDWDGSPADQVSARQTSYWVVLRQFPADVWLAAVRATIETRRETIRADGTRIRPGFPPAADLVALCRDLSVQRRAALPAPAVVPAPPDRALAHIRAIKARLRAARGPLAGALREGPEGEGR